METNLKKGQVLAAFGILLFLVSVIGTGFYFIESQSLSENLDKEKLQTERLLSEKLLLEKDIAGFQNDLKQLSAKNENLDVLNIKTNVKLSAKEAEIKNLNKQGATIQMLRKQNSGINQLKAEMEKRYVGELQNLKHDNDSLEVLTVSLQDKNKQLNDDLKAMALSATNNYRMETVKKNLMNKERLTVKAKQTRKIELSFEVAQSMETDLNFIITKPDGNKVSGLNEGISYIVSKEAPLSASVGSQNEICISKRVEMTYAPKAKLAPGLYSIQIQNKGQQVGSCQVKLR
ncbi:MAG: hypothetical protein ABI723_06095 [Bacteroidia bacterium]